MEDSFRIVPSLSQLASNLTYLALNNSFSILDLHSWFSLSLTQLHAVECTLLSFVGSYLKNLKKFVGSCLKNGMGFVYYLLLLKVSYIFFSIQHPIHGWCSFKASFDHYHARLTGIYLPFHPFPPPFGQVDWALNNISLAQNKTKEK